MQSSEVLKSIGGLPYQIMSQDIVGNVNTGIWYPEIHINVGNQSEVTVVMDSTSNYIQFVNVVPIISKAAASPSPSSFGVDYYSGSNSLDGIYMTVKGTPTINIAGNNNLGTFFLVNALENGATDGNACNSAYTQSSYFAQAGLAFNAGSAYLVYTDTTWSCSLQYISSSLIPYVAGHQYVMYIAVNQSTNKWYVYEQDITSGGGIFYQTISNTVPNSNIFKTSDGNTSVFLENKNAGTTWYTKYTPASIQATAQARKALTTPWIQWDADTQVDQDCSGVNHSYQYSGQVINSGTNLKSGSTATWSFQNLANYHC